MYVKVNTRKCELRVTDNYVTVYNGKKIEDSNPNGTNAFVKNELGDLLWDHCTESSNLIALDTAEFPKDPQNAGHMGKWGVNQDVNFWYLGSGRNGGARGLQLQLRHLGRWSAAQEGQHSGNPHLEGTRGAHLALRPQVDRSSGSACRRYHGSEQGLRGQERDRSGQLRSRPDSVAFPGRWWWARAPTIGTLLSVFADPHPPRGGVGAVHQHDTLGIELITKGV